jgi:hypothetical protein
MGFQALSEIPCAPVDDQEIAEMAFLLLHVVDDPFLARERIRRRIRWASLANVAAAAKAFLDPVPGGSDRRDVGCRRPTMDGRWLAAYSWSDDRIIGASAGDSEAWLLSDDECDALTTSQGRKRIGSGSAEPASFACSFTSGILIVGTDGLFAYATTDAISRATRSAPPEAMAARLIDLVRLPRGGLADDTTVVVVARV